MGRPLVRQQQPFEPVEWTWRVRGGLFLLRPDSKLVPLLCGVLGRLLYLMGDDLRLFYVALESNHLHVYAAARNAQVAAAARCHLATNISKEVRRLRGLPFGGIWARRGRSIPILSGLLSRLQYAAAHGYKSGLVARVLDWPGLGLLQALVTGATVHGTWYDRDRYARALLAWRRRKAAHRSAGGPKPGPKPRLSSFGTRYPVTLTPPPEWANDGPEALRANWQALVDAAEAQFERPARPLGLAKVLATSPLSSPPATPARTPAPVAHGSFQEVRRWRAAYRVQVETYRAAVRALADGREVQFPWASWVPPAWAHLRAAPPISEASALA